jgi:hypothetical protein
MEFRFVAMAKVAAAKMKFKPFVTSVQSKKCKRHFSGGRQLSRKLRQKDNAPSMLIQKDDELRSCEGTIIINRLAKQARFRGRNMSSTLNGCRVKSQWYNCPCGNSPQHGGYHQAKTGQRL